MSIIQTALQSASVTAGDVGEIVVLLVAGTLTLATLAGLAEIFTKADRPWWGAFIPVYSYLVILRLIGRPLWWVVLLVVPLIGTIVRLVAGIELAKSFGRGGLFGIGLALLPMVFVPMLGFGDSRYGGPSVPQSVQP